MPQSVVKNESNLQSSRVFTLPDQLKISILINPNYDPNTIPYVDDHNLEDGRLNNTSQDFPRVNTGGLNQVGENGNIVQYTS